jgi:hypothetical protein
MTALTGNLFAFAASAAADRDGVDFIATKRVFAPTSKADY